jgi:hypothetical protein
MTRGERITVIDEARKNKPVRSDRVWCKNDWLPFNVYSVPVDALSLNIDNRRFTAEKTLVEERLGHTLDPENNPNDELSVVSILLDSAHTVDGEIAKGTPSRASTALKKDWLKRGQEAPFWIRPDGTVHNGNRRLAMLKRMVVDDGIEGNRYVEAIVLDPEEVNDQQLFEMEQREQLTENFKVRYTDINLLITLREAAEARKIDWNSAKDIERVAGELQDLVEGKKDYAEIQLRTIKYLDDYLVDHNAPGQYHKVVRRIERFRDVGKIMEKMLTDYPDEAADMLRVLFASIDGGITHGNIRTIGNMFKEDRTAYKQLRDRVFQVQDGVISAPKLESPRLEEVDTDTDDDDDVQEPAPVVADFPRERIQSVILDAIDGYSARDLEVGRKLTQVASRLQPVTSEILREALASADGNQVRESLKEIIAWADAAKSLMQH